MAPTLAPRRSRLARAAGEVRREVVSRQALVWLLVLRGSRGKLARFSRRINHLPRLLVLPSTEEDSPEMAQEIGPHDAEFVLRQIPGEL
jgi:hypothetical protein